MKFLTGPSVIAYHNFDCDEKKMTREKKCDVYRPLRKRLVFLVREPKQIAYYSKGFFDHYLSNYLPIDLPRVFGEFLYLLKMVKWRYRK